MNANEHISTKAIIVTRNSLISFSVLTSVQVVVCSPAGSIGPYDTTNVVVSSPGRTTYLIHARHFEELTLGATMLGPDPLPRY